MNNDSLEEKIQYLEENLQENKENSNLLSWLKELQAYRKGSNKKDIEFIEYTGEYPNLCSGVLKIKVNGTYYELYNILDSTGTCYIDSNGVEQITKGEWKWRTWNTKFPIELIPYKKDILKIVNSKVPYGCCGGCL